MDKLLSHLRYEKGISTGDKFKMVEAWFNEYQEMIHTTTQSSDDLKKHLQQLELIGCEKEYYRGLL